MHYTDYDTRLAAYAVILDDRDRVLLALWNEADEPRADVRRDVIRGGRPDRRTV